MLELIISGKPEGPETLMYSAIGQKGLERMVPTYPVIVHDEHGEILYQFSVTRRCRREVFNGTKPRDYRQGRECPPNMAGHPYLGRITTAGRLGFAIMLYEKWCEKGESLRGAGRHLRKGIKIHYGPATSFGCMAIAGGAEGYRRFVEMFTVIGKQHGMPMFVTVEERVD